MPASMIKFLCPNGHQLSAPENLAGKAGKCPKCGTAFVVPGPDEEDEGERSPPGAEPSPAAAASAENGGAEAASGDSGKRETPAMGSGTGKAVTGEVFVFLCPNGHKLNGPPSLKGKPGQCPHCGAKFHIPADDELEPPDEEVPADDEEEEQQRSGPRSGSGSGFNFAGFGGPHTQQQEEEEEEFIEAVVEDPPVAPPPPGPSGLGYIVSRLWEQRSEHTELEIFLMEGEIVAPDEFSEVLSSSDYGVFAIQEGDGTFALTVIPWSAVRRVGMRKLDDLPPQLF